MWIWHPPDMFKALILYFTWDCWKHKMIHNNMSCQFQIVVRNHSLWFWVCITGPRRKSTLKFGNKLAQLRSLSTVWASDNGCKSEFPTTLGGPTTWLMAQIVYDGFLFTKVVLFWVLTLLIDRNIKNACFFTSCLNLGKSIRLRKGCFLLGRRLSLMLFFPYDVWNYLLKNGAALWRKTTFLMSIDIETLNPHVNKVFQLPVWINQPPGNSVPTFVFSKQISILFQVSENFTPLVYLLSAIDSWFSKICRIVLFGRGPTTRSPR